MSDPPPSGTAESQETNDDPPDRARLRGRLDALRPRELRALASRFMIDLRGLRRKSELVAALTDSPSAGPILREMEHAAQLDVSQVKSELVAARDAIRDAANLGAAVGAAEDAWMVAAQKLEDGDASGASESLSLASRRATEARERRIGEIERALVMMDDHFTLAENLGADTSVARRLRSDAQAAVRSGDYARADDLVRRAERDVMESAQRQISRAIQLREAEVERAQVIIASCEPLLQEAESYGLSAADVRTLLRQARDVLAKGDYVGGVQFARNAEEATYRLEARVEEERQRRGIVRPRAGVCGACGSDRLTFYDDGWGRCGSCGASFRWRDAEGLRERLRGLLGS